MLIALKTDQLIMLQSEGNIISTAQLMLWQNYYFSPVRPILDTCSQSRQQVLLIIIIIAINKNAVYKPFFFALHVTIFFFVHRHCFFFLPS